VRPSASSQPQGADFVTVTMPEHGSALYLSHHVVSTNEKRDTMAKPNFAFQKRQKELEKKKKNEEKLQRKLEKKSPLAGEEAAVEGAVSDES
jgi:hypothetical protein